jgi:LysR family transcriptional regulator, regulator for bpeEF and oprC
VGAHGFVAQHCITPALPALHARYPDLQIDVRPVDRVTDSSASVVDVFLLLGWPEPANLVQRRIAETRFVICAAPTYWAQHAPPAHPRDLVNHDCLLFRIPDGRLLDFWQCERQGERADIAVTGWLVSNHRDVLLDTALAGHGVGRFVDVTVLPHLRSGALVPVLTDWRQLDAPPVSLLYRPHHRRTPRVRVFIDFMNDLFRRLDAERDGPFKVSLPTQKPRWYKLRSSRVSAGVKTGR